MTDEPIPMEFIGVSPCHKAFPHDSHDWYVFSNLDYKIGAYRCHGVDYD